MIETPNAMRLAFARATASTPVKQRTALYAKVRSALSRKLGLHKRRAMWSVQRVR